jgi:tetratricopeptide (TPR) repeat protein
MNQLLHLIGARRPTIDPGVAAHTSTDSRSSRKGLPALLVSIALTGCATIPSEGRAQPEASGGSAQTQAAPGPSTPRPVLPDIELTPQLIFQLLAAELAAQRGEIGTAAATYLSVAQKYRDPRVARRATELSLTARTPKRALTAARLWLELEPGSALAAQTVQALQLSTGDLKAAEESIIRQLDLARRQGGLAAAYDAVQRALLRVQDRAQALELLERVSAPDQDRAEAQLALATLAQAAGERPRASGYALRALELAGDDAGTVVKAAQLLAADEAARPRAISALEAFITRAPKSTEARFTLARLLAQTGRREDARQQFEAALEIEPKSPAILFALAQLAYQTKHPEDAERYLRRFLDLPADIERDEDAARMFLGQLAEEGRRFEEAVKWYEQVGPGDQQLSAITRKAIVLGRLGRVDEARLALREAPVTEREERLRLISVEAQVLRAAGRHNDAFKLIDDALAQQPDEADLLYDHAMAAEKIDRIDVLERSLRRLIELRPESAHAYNALGYTLADRGLRLEEAQQLIEKAISLSPNDGHIIDSLGWVFFRRGQFAQAIEQLRKAFDKMPEAEIAAHLGEVLLAAGQRDEAIRIFRRGREIDAENETLVETLRRLGLSL